VRVKCKTGNSAAIRARNILFGEQSMTVKANNSAAWLAEVEKRVGFIKTGLQWPDAALQHVHELIAAAQILREELAIELNTASVSITD
jgi:hypothetical protein